MRILAANGLAPSAGTLDPEKEIKASVMAIQHGLSTHSDEAVKLNGSQFERNIARLTQENAMLAAAGGGEENAAIPQAPRAPQEKTPETQEGESNAE